MKFHHLVHLYGILTFHRLLLLNFQGGWPQQFGCLPFLEGWNLRKNPRFAWQKNLTCQVFLLDKAKIHPGFCPVWCGSNASKKKGQGYFLYDTMGIRSIIRIFTWHREFPCENEHFPPFPFKETNLFSPKAALNLSTLSLIVWFYIQTPKPKKLPTTSHTRNELKKQVSQTFCTIVYTPKNQHVP